MIDADRLRLLSANVRGLNNPVRRDAVRDLIRDCKATVVCLQESKLHVVDRQCIIEALGVDFADNFAFLPADGTRGGIILAASGRLFDLSNAATTANTITATITSREDGFSWTATGVYGPQGEAQKIAFINELRGLAATRPARWLIFGDFNLIYRAADKNNGNLNRRLMGSFKSALDAMRLRELRLAGRKFTWSNEQATPTMTRIDRFFCSDDWDVSFPSAILQSLPSSVSDHAPLILVGAADIPRHRPFRFESYWLRMEGFQETVQLAWDKEVATADPVRRLHVKLETTARELKRWQRRQFGNLRLQLAIAREVIGRLDVAQESRLLSPLERGLRLSMRAKVLGFAVLNKIRMRQRARLSTIKLGDANTRLFHLRANGRRRRKYIQSLATDRGLAISHAEKEEALRAHFEASLGATQPRAATLNWAALGYQSRNLAQLDDPFSMEELRVAVFAMPPEKAPGPDGFIGLFFRTCWEVICDDLLAAITAMTEDGGGNFGLLNKANIVLLPKKMEVAAISDYRPISLIHSVSKIFSKMLAARLAPLLPGLVSPSQSAFIKRRCIHDNFLHVQGLIKELHKERIPGLFLKLDISKAFDSVSWSYLIELLETIGFGPRWRRWICLLLSSASSAVLLNGRPGPAIRHGRGLRQGDPISPMLFILAIDPLHHLFRLATEEGLLRPIRQRPIRCTVSLYADDAGIFVSPDVEDLKVASKILEIFADATGLRTNLAKSVILPVRCTEEQIAAALTHFPATRGSFPCTYLGLPLHHSRLKAVHFQPLLDKLGARLAGWLGRHFTRAGRVLLCRVVLSSMAIYHLAALRLPKGILRRIEKIKRCFLWMKTGAAPGARPQALVNWSTVCRPKELGGLGIFDVEKFGRALRLRWPWYAWTEPDRPWHGMALPCDKKDMALFRASTEIVLGDGATCSFWHDRWLPGGALRLQFPDLFRIATRKCRTVQKELFNRNWIRSLAHITSAEQMAQFVLLWNILQEIALQPTPDTITWRWTASGVYSAASAYRCQFVGSCAPFSSDKLWKAKAEPKCRYFAWLVLHGKILTAENLAIRGWPNDPICKLCRICPETVQHLLLDCSFASQVRERVFAEIGVWGTLPPPLNRSINDWWDATIAAIPRAGRRGASGAIIYSLWGTWKERNRRVFRNVALSPTEVAALVREEVAQRAYAHTQDPGDV